jgi:hypothetical protein
MWKLHEKAWERTIEQLCGRLTERNWMNSGINDERLNPSSMNGAIDFDPMAHSNDLKIYSAHDPIVFAMILAVQHLLHIRDYPYL